MPSPEQIKFFQDNEAYINKLVRDFNKSRVQKGFPQLSGEEFDSIMPALMAWATAGNEIKDFQIDLPDPPKEEYTEPESGSGEIQCKFLPCENGYVAKIKDKSYIFKTEKELMKIFKILFFAEAQ